MTVTRLTSLPASIALATALLSLAGCGVELDCESIGAQAVDGTCEYAEGESATPGQESPRRGSEEDSEDGGLPNENEAPVAEPSTEGDDGGLAPVGPQAPDDDEDGVANDEDNCPDDPNPAQADPDGDGLGDACDPDDDGDGHIDEVDLCPGTSDPQQLDADDDGLGDACDDDIDGDGLPNAEDACPEGLREGPDMDGDGCKDGEDPDLDGDGTANLADPCPDQPEGNSEVDGDGCPPEADACPLGFASGPDADADGCKDSEDPEPDTPNEIPARVYVDSQQKSRTPNGRSWESAFTQVTEGLAEADDLFAAGAASVQVWVAEGTYYPDEGGIFGPGDREATFVVRPGIELIGGFRFDGAQGAWERDALDTTVLSGDLAQNDPMNRALAFENLLPNGGDNACHVVTVVPGDLAPVLDGFRIEGGNATRTATGSSPACTYPAGGGIVIPREEGRDGGRATFRNLDIVGNYTDGLGAGAAVFDVDSQWIDCTVRENRSGATAGGLLISVAGTQTTVIYGTRFEGNAATTSGALHLLGGQYHTVTNSEFVGNSADWGSAVSSASTVALVSHGSFGGNGPGPSINVISGTAGVYDSVLWNNSADAAAATTSGSPILSYFYSLVSNGDGGIVPPHSPETWSPFANPPDASLAPFAGGDLSLDPSGSYAIDAAVDGSCVAGVDSLLVPGRGRLCDATNHLRYDITGGPRIRGDGADLGARETLSE